MLSKWIAYGLISVAALTVSLAPAPHAWGDGGTTIVRILDGKGYDDFSFTGSSGEVLFVDMKANVYQMHGRTGGSHESMEMTSDPVVVTAMEGGGGCSGEEGGPGGFCVQVLDSAGTAVCWADRPVQPGWQRDPRLACPLPEDGLYTLRIFLRGDGENVCSITSGYLPAAGLGKGKRLYSFDVAKRDCAATGTLELGGPKN